jgi:O-antigen ligase
MYSAVQVLFFLLYFVVLFLLLVFGETTIGIVLLGILTTACLAALLLRSGQRNSQTHLAVGAFAIFVVVTAFSITQTISVPFSVNAAMFFAASFVVMLSVMKTDKKWMDAQFLLGGLVILSAVFVVLTLLFTSIPELSRSLPTTSLLTALYGHNQASVLFLLVIPIAWFFAERRSTPILMAVVGLLFVGVVFSFARVALLLAIIELGVLTVTTKSRNLRRLGIVVGTFCIGSAILFSLGSLSFFNNEWCVVPVWQDKLCKSIHAELRPAYWSQAVRAGIERPILGWGGGTFSLLSPRFQLKPSEYSGYAHSELLQAFAEYGIVGGGVFFIFLFTIVAAALSGFRSRDLLQQRLSLAVIVVVVSSFFDFSLHMAGIWISFVMVLALFLRESDDRSFDLPTFFTFSVQILSVISGALVILWSSCFVLSELVWKNDPSRSVQLFPYAYWKVDVVIQEPEKFSPEVRTWISELYAEHYRTWDVVASKSEITSTDRAKALQRAIQLDPFGQTRYFPYVTAAIESGEYDLMHQALSEWERAHIAGKLDMYSYQTHGEVAALALEAGNSFFQNEKTAEAFSLYIHATKIQPEQLLHRSLVGVAQIQKVPLHVAAPFLKVMMYDTLFPYEHVLYEYQVQQLRQSISANDAQSAELLVDGLLKLGAGYNWKVAKVIADEWKSNQQYPKLFSTLISRWEMQGEKTGFDFAVKEEVTKKSGVSADTD